MYPSVMVEGIYPYGDPHYGETPPNFLYKIKMIKIIIVKAKIKSPDYPPLMRP